MMIVQTWLSNKAFLLVCICCRLGQSMCFLFLLLSLKINFEVEISIERSNLGLFYKEFAGGRRLRKTIKN